jgi:hypothetical protein
MAPTCRHVGRFWGKKSPTRCRHYQPRWREPGTNNLWRIPLVPVVRNNNTDTIIVKRPSSEYFPNRPAPSEAIHNIYELKTQPELIRYLHAAAGFPTKPTWYKAVKNGQFVSWPGLTAAAVAKHFPESEETIKGHARKTRSGLRSTKRKQSCEVNTDNKDNDIGWSTPHQASGHFHAHVQRRQGGGDTQHLL